MLIERLEPCGSDPIRVAVHSSSSPHSSSYPHASPNTHFVGLAHLAAFLRPPSPPPPLAAKPSGRYRNRPLPPPPLFVPH